MAKKMESQNTITWSIYAVSILCKDVRFFTVRQASPSFWIFGNPAYVAFCRQRVLGWAGLTTFNWCKNKIFKYLIVLSIRGYQLAVKKRGWGKPKIRWHVPGTFSLESAKFILDNREGKTNKNEILNEFFLIKTNCFFFNERNCK